MGSHLAAIVGVAGLVTAVVGAIAGLSAYAFYTVDLIGADASATLIIVSVLAALGALLIGLVASRLARRRDQDDRIALSGVFVAVGTLGSWFVVVAVALGK